MIFESSNKFLDTWDLSILETYNKLNIYGKIGEKLKDKREYLEEQNAKISLRVDSLENTIKELNLDIKNISDNVDIINAQIIDTESQVEASKKAIEILKRKVEKSTEVLTKYLVYMYKKWDTISSQNDIDILKSILISGENIDSLLNDLYYNSLIQVSGKKLIDTHRSLITQLYVKKIEMEKSEEKLRALRKQNILEKKILSDKRASKERLLTVTQSKESLYNKYIKEKLELERDVKVKELQQQIKLNNTKKELLKKYNCEFIDLSNNSVDLSGASNQCKNINKIIFAESRIAGVSTKNNPLSWPVLPFAGVSALFRDTEYKREFGTDHDALDIVAVQGTSIRAPMDGYVIYLQPPVNTGYAYIALKHSDGLVTLYGHISKTNVGLYDFVKKGDVFAETGGEYGTNGAWVLTTWAHLHFVAYEDGEYVDPLNYLDLSYLKYEQVPDRYQYKYVADFKSRRGYDYKADTSSRSNVFRIEWDNEVERQKYLLSTYAVGNFRDWDIWVEESIAANIDPTFMMCVGLAETSLGKYMKSVNNIGNVGNNDRGDTRDFSSAREWIHWMTKTFNNKYLGGYNQINQLSRYGNKDGAIYASSEFNWHNNITKCMSHVKGEFIPDDYFFRIGKY